MDQNSPNNFTSKLYYQIAEAHGKILYTQVCHEKMADRFAFRDSVFKVLQIVLSALTTGGFISILAMPEKETSVFGVVVSTLLLILSSYSKGFNLLDMQQKHQVVAVKLWKIREEYVSLLVDFENLPYEKIILRRDGLQSKTCTTYEEAPRTDKKSFKAAQKALKVRCEQSFTVEEVARLLPEALQCRKS